MLKRMFVAFTFHENNTLSRKVESFRKRFDPKFDSKLDPHISLLAPFEIDVVDTNNLVEELQEEVESFFHGHSANPKLGILGLDMVKVSKEYLLYLNPNFNDDLLHCMEGVQAVCESYIPKNVTYQKNKKQFIPVARSYDIESLDLAVQVARDEFNLNSELSIKSISLFEKRFGMWINVADLMTFEKNAENFLLSNASSL